MKQKNVTQQVHHIPQNNNQSCTLTGFTPHLPATVFAERREAVGFILADDDIDIINNHTNVFK